MRRLCARGSSGPVSRARRRRHKKVVEVVEEEGVGSAASRKGGRYRVTRNPGETLDPGTNKRGDPRPYLRLTGFIRIRNEGIARSTCANRRMRLGSLCVSLVHLPGVLLRSALISKDDKSLWKKEFSLSLSTYSEVS